MIKTRKYIYPIRCVSILLSVLLLWQGMVWADPGLITNRDQLQPRTLISDPAGQVSAVMAYLTGTLAACERDPLNRNIFRMKDRAQEAINQLETSVRILEALPVIKDEAEEGEFVIDLGLCIIRYYNPKLRDALGSNPGRRVIEQKRIGEYLARQIILNGDDGRDERLIRESVAPKPGESTGPDVPGSPPQEEEGRTSPHTSSLDFVASRLKVRYSAFFHAPVAEELLKVGLPLGVLIFLRKFGCVAPPLMIGLFYSGLILAGSVFTAGHIYNLSAQERTRLDLKRAFSVFAAPFATAAGGIALASVLASQPAWALLLSMGWHLFVNLMVAFLRRSGMDGMYASFFKRGRDDDLVGFVMGLVPEGGLIAREYPRIKEVTKSTFGIDIDQHEYASLRARLALKSAGQSPRKTVESFSQFNLDPYRYPETVHEIALLCINVAAGHAAMNFRNFGFDAEHHEHLILDLAQHCASCDGESTSRHYKRFGLVERSHAVKIATLSAMQNGHGVALYFDQFGLDPTASRKELREVSGIAQIASRESPESVAVNFRNFGFDEEHHQEVILNLALSCARHNGRSTAVNFRKFGLRGRRHAESVARACAGENLEGTLRYFGQFGLDMDEKEALEFCRKAERDLIAELSSNTPDVPLYQRLCENGQNLMRIVDETYDLLDLSALSIGAQAYVKLLLLEEVASKEEISERFIARLKEEVIPGLMVLEKISKDYPAMGLDYHRSGRELLSAVDAEHSLRAKLVNYISRTRTPHELDRSVLKNNGERIIRLPPAPYPVMLLFAGQLENMRIIDARDFGITVSGDHMREGLFLFSLMYFAGARPVSRTSSGEVPGKPWIAAGRKGYAIDPWTGKRLGGDDPATGGTQTKFFLIGSNALMKRKLAMAFYLVTASSASTNGYGITDKELEKIYLDMKEQIGAFYREDLVVGKVNMDRLENVQLDEFLGRYVLNTDLVSTALETIDTGLRDDPEANDVVRLVNGNIHERFRDLVDAHIDRIRSHIFPEEVQRILDQAYRGDFKSVKQSVLSMCFSGPETSRRALELARYAYPVEYGKIRRAEEKQKASSRSLAASIIRNASRVINEIVNSLFAFSGKEKKVLIALDLDIGEGRVNSIMRDILEVLPDLEKNNKDLERFFRDLEIIKGEGGILARRVESLTDPEKGSVDPENLIVLTSKNNLEYYDRFEGRATLAGIDSSDLPEGAYLPVLETMLFAIGRHLGWDRQTLMECYRTIPNVISYDELSMIERDLLFGETRSAMVLRLIPDATSLGIERLRDIMENIKLMLARA
ncbi:MAG: hypothetical protein GF409_05440 [Candidatus Omnitrophica bacterium]|nr:hypothetical protein [Candidatus Omnitrophota bacterium]